MGTSLFRNIRVGVPQGSVLGPQLFSIFINDLIDKLEMYEPTVFADDVGIVITAGTVSCLENKVNNAVKIFERWALDSHIKINKNPGKTEYIHVRPSGTHDKSPVVVYSEEHTFKYVVATAEQMSNLKKTHILTDSMSLIQALERGPEEQKSATNASIWKLALKLEHRGVNINMQYVRHIWMCCIMK